MLGAGSQPIPQKKLNADDLAAAITQVTSDQGIMETAAELGRQICAEDGVKRSIEFIEAQAK